MIGKKNNQSLVPDADREIQPSGQQIMLVNLVPDIIRIPSGWDFSVCIGD